MKNIRIILFWIVASLAPLAAFSQQVVLTTDTINIPCTSTDTFIIPVKVVNFNNLGGLQFTLEWNTTNVKYIHVQDFNPLLTNGFVNMDTTTHLNKGQLTFAWLDPSGLSIPNTENNTLFSVAVVRLSGGFSPLAFDTTALPFPPPTAIAVSTPSFTPLPFELSNGGVRTIDPTPPVITCPANVNAVSSFPIPVANIAPTTGDNCGIQQTGWTATGATIANFPTDPDASGAVFNIGTSQVTYSTTDFGGNTVSCSFTINIQFDPAASDSLTFIAASGTADCDQVFFVDITTVNFDSVFGAQFSLAWLNSVLQFDSIGMLNTAINLDQGANFNLNFTQNGNPAGSGNLSFGWNSDNASAGSSLPNGAVLFRIYFTVVGPHGAASGIDFVGFPAAPLAIDPNLSPIPANYLSGAFEVEDNVNPTLQCPQNQSVTAVPGQPSAVVNGLDPLTLSDNCSGAVNLTYTPAGVGNGAGNGAANGTFPGGTTTVTYTATDAAGNTATCSFLVTVDLGEVFELAIDSVEFSCGTGTNTISIPFRVFNFDDIAGMNFRVEWDETVLSYTGFSNVFPGTGINGSSFPSAGSTAPQGFLNFLHVSPSGQWPNIPDGGIIFRLNFTVLNQNGVTPLTFNQPLNAINGSFQNTAAMFTNGYFESVDLTGPVLTCPPNQIVPGSANCTATVTLQPATATDACGVITGITTSVPTVSVFQPGANQVVYTATDNSGNTSTCAITITVNANTALQIPGCPVLPIIVEAIDSCSAPIDYPLLNALNPCVANANFVYNYNFPVGTVRPVGTTTVVVTATQLGSGGGFVTCNFTVEVVDAGAPVLDCPADFTIETTGADCFVVDPVIPEPNVSDNCEQNLTAFIDPDLIDTLFAGQNSLIYLAADSKGNLGACSFVVTVRETQAPDISCPPSQVIPASGPNCQGEAFWNDPVVSDNCSDAADVIVLGSAASGDFFDVGSNTVTYTATDEAGNVAECSFEVLVLENTPPVFNNCPGNVVIILPANDCDTLLNYNPTATDNCGLSTIVSNIQFPFEFPSGVTEVVFVAIDLAGNRDTCSFTVSALDQIAPVFTSFPADVVINNADPCGAILNIQPPTASDNCDPNPLITFAGSLQDTFPPGVTQIEIRVTDASGNITQDTLTITVNSIQVPTFNNIPSNQSIPGCFGVATWTAPTVSGFCGIPVVTSNFMSGDTFPIGVTTVTYVATSANNNSISVSFTITVTDPEGPEFTCPSDTIVVNAAGVVLNDPLNLIDAIAPTANCSSVDLALAEPIATDNCGMPTVVQTSGPAPQGNYPIGTYALTYQATDESGQTATCVVHVQVLEFTLSEPRVNPNPGCEGDMVVLTVPSFPGATYTWTGPQSSYPNAPQITILSLSQGNTGAYSVSASLNGCTAQGDTVVVVMVVKPNAENDLNYNVGIGDTLTATSVLLNDQFTLLSDLTVTLSSPLDGLTFNPDGTFTFIGGRAGAYSFIYEICSKACPELCDMATVTITVQDNECNFIPNIFTPNGDMTNDYFEIPCLNSGLYPNSSLVVYNQWGDKVFESENYSNAPDKAWKGALNNEDGKDLPDGVYYYIFQQDATAPAVKGFVHIFR